MSQGITKRPFAVALSSIVVALMVSPLPGRATSTPKLMWSKVDGSTVVDNAVGVSLDAQENLLVAGWTNGAFSGFVNAGQSDVYIAQYAPNGLRRWVRQFGSRASDIPAAIATDSAGNSYVFGHTYGNFDENTPQSAGDFFIVKMKNDGSELWRKQFGTAGADQAGGVAVDASDNLYVVGSTEGNIAGAANEGETDVVISKYSATGTQLWIKQFGTTNFDYGYGIAVDAWGTIAVVGETQGQFPGMRETGITDAFLATFSANGTLRWLRQEDSGPDLAYNKFTSVVMDDFENIIVGGSTGGSYGEDTSVSGVSDAVVVKYNKLSSRLWVRQFGTNSSDVIMSLSRAPNGDVFAVGDTRGRVFGYEGPVGDKDAFIAGMNSSGALTWWQQYGTSHMDALVSVDSAASGSVVAVGFTKGALTPGLSPRSEDSVMMKWSVFDPVVQPSSTLAVGESAPRSVVLALGKLTAPIGSKVKLTIATASRSKCSVVGSSVLARRVGSCRVVVDVTNQAGVLRRATITLSIR